MGLNSNADGHLRTLENAGWADIPSASFKVIRSLRPLEYPSAWQDLRFFRADLLAGKARSVLKMLSSPLN